MQFYEHIAALVAAANEGLKSSAPSEMLSSGQETLDRRMAWNAVSMGTGILRLSYFTSRRTETVNNVRLLSGATAAGATPTLVRAGLYSVAANGDLTLLSACASDTSIFSGVNSSYLRALAVGVPLVAGSRYALGVLVVTASTAPVTFGVSATIPSEASMAPRLAAFLNSQADLPGTVANASLQASASIIYGVVV